MQEKIDAIIRERDRLKKQRDSARRALRLIRDYDELPRGSAEAANMRKIAADELGKRWR
jgi:hypothetical protein